MIAVNGTPLDFNTTDEKGRLKDRRAEIVQKEMDDIRKNYKFPIRMCYLKSLLTINPDRPNRPEKPANIPIRTTIKVDGAAGSELITYFETSTPDGKGGHRFSPNMIPFSGSKLIPEEKIDLAWFIIKVYPHVENNDAKGSRKKYYYIEDKAKEAREEVEAEKEITRFKSLIYDDDFGFGEKKLKEVAKAYYISGVDEMDINEVRSALNKTITYAAENNRSAYKDFLESTNVVEEIKARALIQDGIEGKYIKLDQALGKKKWRWLDSDQKYVGESIINVLPGEQSHEILCYHLANNEEDRRTLADLIETGRFHDVKKMIRPEQQAPPPPPPAATQEENKDVAGFNPENKTAEPQPTQAPDERSLTVE